MQLVNRGKVVTVLVQPELIESETLQFVLTYLLDTVHKHKRLNMYIRQNNLIDMQEKTAVVGKAVPILTENGEHVGMAVTGFRFSFSLRPLKAAISYIGRPTRIRELARHDGYATYTRHTQTMITLEFSTSDLAKLIRIP